MTAQNPAYVYLQAACTSPYIPNVNSLPRPYPGLGRILSLQNVAIPATTPCSSRCGVRADRSLPDSPIPTVTRSTTRPIEAIRCWSTRITCVRIGRVQTSISATCLTFSYVYQHSESVARWLHDVPLKLLPQDRRLQPPENCCSRIVERLRSAGGNSPESRRSVGHAVHRDQQCGQHRHFAHRQCRRFERARNRSVVSRRGARTAQAGE